MADRRKYWQDACCCLQTGPRDIGYVDEALTLVVWSAMAQAKLDVPEKSGGGIKEKDKDSEEKEGARLLSVAVLHHESLCYNSGKYASLYIILQSTMQYII